jgi:hypothetical protein
MKIKKNFNNSNEFSNLQIFKKLELNHYNN